MKGEGMKGAGGGGTGRRRRHPGGVVGRDPVGETEEEIRFHLDLLIRDYMEAGMDEGDALAAAKRRMGDLDAVRRDVRSITRARRRSERIRGRLSEVGHDLRYGLRTLSRAPVFASMAVLTLALGIGATTAVFSLVWAVLLAPLPYAQPDRLVRIWETSPQGATRNVVSPGNVVDWQERARSFSVLAAHSGAWPVTLTGDGSPDRVVQAQVQPDVFEVLGVEPALGRTLAREDAATGDVVVMGHATWQSRYGGDRDVLGRRVILEEVPHTVVGVMPPDFVFPDGEVRFWLPLTDQRLDPAERTSHNYSVVARLAPGVTVERAQAEMDGIVAAITEEHPAQMTGWGARVVPIHDDLTRDVRALFRVLLGGVGVVLLITCGNLANLLLSRAVARQKEIALRGALGAGRGRILRQLLTESGLLALLGGAGALVLAPLLLAVLRGAAPADIPLLERAAIDLRMLAFTGAVATACALLFGLAPALRLAGLGLRSTVRDGRDGSGPGHQRLRSALLVGQMALSVALLIGAGLFVRSFQALQSTELGFESRGLVRMDVNLPFARYGETPEQVAFYERLVERVRGLPAIAAAAGTTHPPGNGSGMTFSFAIEGRVPSNPSGREDDETLHAVSPGYLEVLGARMVRGRAFDDRDRADGAPVVIVNEALARKHWPGGNPVGERLAFRVGETPWREIVGVVADARLESPDVEPEPAVFIPFAQKSWPWLTFTTVVARTASGTDPGAVSEALRRTLLGLDPSLPPLSMSTVEETFRENTARRTFAMTLVAGFGLLALVLSVVGLYGLVTYSVGRSRREIGVRIALGATSTDVVGRVLRHSAGLALAGAAFGVAVAAAASSVLEGLLYGVPPIDASTYGATAALVVAVALATAAWPALRAAHTDPMRALAAE